MFYTEKLENINVLAKFGGKNFIIPQPENTSASWNISFQTFLFALDNLFFFFSPHICLGYTKDEVVVNMTHMAQASFSRNYNMETDLKIGSKLIF